MQRRVAILTLSNPEEANHGGTIRTRGIGKALLRLGAHVEYFYPENPVGERIRRLSKPRQSGTHVKKKDLILGRLGEIKRDFLPMPLSLGARDAKLGSRIRQFRPDIVIVNTLSLFQFVEKLDSTIWLDFLDLWSEFAARESQARSGLQRATSFAQSRYIRGIERRAATRADLVTTAGWADHKTLDLRKIRSEWLPPWVENQSTSRMDDRGHPKTAGFIANFDYWPNRDAFKLLVESWLPILRDNGFRVVVAGRYSNALPQVDGVEVLGEVESVGDFYDRISMSLAPVRLGGGIKIKVVESLIHGIPVLGTRQAVEGLSPSSADLVVTCPQSGPTASILRLVSSTQIDEHALIEYTEGYALSRLSEILENHGPL